MPEVRAIKEVLPGFGFGIVSWQAIFAPAGVPQPVVDNIQLE